MNEEELEALLRHNGLTMSLAVDAEEFDEIDAEPEQLEECNSESNEDK